MKLNPKKTKCIMVSRSRPYTPGYGGLTLGGAELEEVKGLRILGVTFGCKFTFEIPLREVVSKVARSLDIVRQARKLFDCPHVLKICFSAYILPNLEYSAPV